MTSILYEPSEVPRRHGWLLNDDQQTKQLAVGDVQQRNLAVDGSDAH